MVHPLIARWVGVSWLGLLIDRVLQGSFSSSGMELKMEGRMEKIVLGF